MMERARHGGPEEEDVQVPYPEAQGGLEAASQRDEPVPAMWRGQAAPSGVPGVRLLQGPGDRPELSRR